MVNLHCVIKTINSKNITGTLFQGNIYSVVMSKEYAAPRC